MITCIVLNGFHKGHTIELPEILPRLVLLKPKTITIDDCCDGEPVGVDNDLKKEYLLAFLSQDKQVALYTIDGKSKAMTERDWVTPANRNWLETPLYIGIHDPRAVIDNSTLGEEE